MVPLEVRSPYLAEAMVGVLQCASMVTQAHSFLAKVGGNFGKWVYRMPWSPGGRRDELIMVP